MKNVPFSRALGPPPLIELAVDFLRALSIFLSLYVLWHNEILLSLVFFSVFLALAMARDALPRSSMTRYIDEDKCREVCIKYDLTELGFMPVKPVGMLPERYDPWEEIMRELPSLNKSGQIRERIEAMPCLDLKSIEGDEVLTFCQQPFPSTLVVYPAG